MFYLYIILHYYLFSFLFSCTVYFVLYVDYQYTSMWVSFFVLGWRHGRYCSRKEIVSSFVFPGNVWRRLNWLIASLSHAFLKYPWIVHLLYCHLCTKHARLLADFRRKKDFRPLHMQIPIHQRLICKYREYHLHIHCTSLILSGVIALSITTTTRKINSKTCQTYCTRRQWK